MAAQALAPIAREHQLVISHGNGPQVGLLALQGAAYAEAPRPTRSTSSAPRPRAWSATWIEQELGNLLPFEVPFATLLTMVEVRAAGFNNPTEFVGPVYDKPEADRIAAEKQWIFEQDGQKWRRVVPSPMP